MTSGKPLSPAQKQYIENHLEEWPSVVAYRLNMLYGAHVTPRGVRNYRTMIKESKM